MLKGLLIGLDGTAASGPALELGLNWARRFGAVLAGLAVVDEPGIGLSQDVLFAEGYHRPVAPPALPDARRRAGEILGIFRNRCEAAQVACRPLQVEGTPFARIVAEAPRFDLVLLGTETHFEFGARAWADTTLSRVLQECARPVVAVPKSPAIAKGEAILIATDGSREAALALATFEATGLARGSEVHLLSVASERGVAAQAVATAADFLRLHEVEVRDHAVETDRSPADVILDKAERFGVGLLVMGAFGQSALREFFLGSVTRSILERGRVPLFCSH